MDFIQICEYNGEAVTTSRAVAEQFGKQHKNVIQSIEEIISQLNGLKNQPVNPEINVTGLKNQLSNPETDTQTAEFAERNFFLSEYTDGSGKKNKQYILTRDGFTLLAMGFTGAKALQFKVAYINAFDRMESIINGEARLETAKRETLGSIERVNGFTDASGTLSDIVTESLEALRTAYESGRVTLRRKQHPEESTENEAGIYDTYTIKMYTMTLYKLYSEAVSSPLPFNIWIGIMKKELNSQKRHSRSSLVTTIERAGFNPNNSR